MVSSNTRNKVRLLLAVLAATIYFFAKQQFAEMDSQLFQHSVPGAKAVVHYLLGDLNGAAKAYRTLRSAQHRARLNEAPTQVAAGELTVERAAICALWRAVFPT